MRKIIKRLYTILATAACLCAIGGVGSLTAERGEEVSAAATATYDASSFKILQGASVRKKELHGIRFRTAIGNDVLESWGDTYTMGTLIIPENVLTASKMPLTVNFQYVADGVVYTPAVASMQNDESRLVTDPDYTDCKFFNAVLNLSDISKTDPDFLMENLVARSFVTINGVTTYAEETAIRSAAYVAAAALDNGESDDSGVLDTYVQGLESLSFDGATVNVAVGEKRTMSATVTPAGVFPVRYAATSGDFNGNEYVATEAGETTITASVAGGKKTATITVNAVDEQRLTRKYYQESDRLIVKAYNVNAVEYGGRTLRNGQEYVINGNEIEIEKNVLCGSSTQSTPLTLVSPESGDVTVNVVVSYDVDPSKTGLNYADSGKQFEYFSYGSVGTNTRYTDADGVAGGELIEETDDIDYLSQAYIADYYDSGLTYMLPQSATGTGEKLITLMDQAYALGYTNTVFVQDAGVWEVYRDAKVVYASETNYDAITAITPDAMPDNSVNEYDQIIGYDLFRTQEGLERYFYDRMAPYASHPAFGGMILPDEPSAKWLGIIGEIYKALENVYARFEREGIFKASDKQIMCNLLPYTATLANSSGSSSYTKTGKTASTTDFQVQHQEYKDYLQLYFDETGAKTVQTDIYSYYTTLYRYHLLGLQMTAEVAQKNNARMVIVTSSYQRITANERYHDMAALNWLNNSLMGFGAKNIGYYTYHVKNDTSGVDSEGNPTGEIHANDGSFINRQGEKTELYYNVKELNAKSQVLAPVLLNFDYKASLMYNNSCPTAYREYLVNGTYRDNYWAMDNYFNKAAVSDFNDEVIKKNASGQYLTTQNGALMLLTELYDNDSNNHMYMVMNAIAPYYTGDDTVREANIRFQEKYTHAWVYHDGEFTVMELDSTNNGLTFQMAPGEAYYVIPFKYGVYGTGVVFGTDYVALPNSNWDKYWG